MNRRDMIKKAGTAVAGFSLISLDALAHSGNNAYASAYAADASASSASAASNAASAATASAYVSSADHASDAANAAASSTSAYAADASASASSASAASAASADASASAASAESSAARGDRKKILVIGAHPDDPETAAGGTMALFVKAGYEVVSVYMTKGERGIAGKTFQEAVDIRVPEAKAACKILGVRPVFMTQIDGDAQINPERYVEMRELIAAEKPDMVFTHWPIDGHPDHRVCSLLVYDAWRRLGYSFELYYFEVMSGTQTQLFHPTDWVNITDVATIKEQACFCHVSQNMKPLYDEWHIPMEKFRGLELRCPRAEAFIHLRRDSNDIFQ